MSELCVPSISQRAFTSLVPGNVHGPWGGRARCYGLAVVWPHAPLLGSPGLASAAVRSLQVS